QPDPRHPRACFVVVPRGAGRDRRGGAGRHRGGLSSPVHGRAISEAGIARRPPRTAAFAVLAANQAILPTTLLEGRRPPSLLEGHGMTIHTPISAHDLNAAKDRASAWFSTLRDRITAAFEAIEDDLPRGVAGSEAAAGRFVKTPWQRTDHGGAPGGGGVMSIMHGRVF